MKPRKQVNGQTLTCFDVWHRLWKCGKKPPRQLSSFVLKPRQSKRDRSGTRIDEEKCNSDEEDERHDDQDAEDEEVVSDTSTHMPDDDISDTHTHMSPSNPSVGY